MLHEHDNFGSKHGSPISRNGDHLLNDVVAFDNIVLLNLKKRVHVEEIASCLDLVVPESAHGVVRLGMPTFAHVPTWRLWTQEHKTEDDNCG